MITFVLRSYIACNAINKDRVVMIQADDYACRTVNTVPEQQNSMEYNYNVQRTHS